jgi:general secretion pathway protein E
MEMPKKSIKQLDEECRHTGYKGRVGIYEFMPIEAKQRLVHVTLDDLKMQAKKEGIEPLRIAGARKVIKA